MAFEGATGSGLDNRAKPREYPPSFGSGESVSLVRGFVFLLLKSLPTPVRLGADAALSLIRHAGLESVREFIRALSRSSRGAEMKTEMSPRALVFSSGRPERNAVSIATCRHSVMTGERVLLCACVRACTAVYGHNNDGGVVCCCCCCCGGAGGADRCSIIGESAPCVSVFKNKSSRAKIRRKLCSLCRLSESRGYYNTSRVEQHFIVCLCKREVKIL